MAPAEFETRWSSPARRAGGAGTGGDPARRGCSVHGRMVGQNAAFAPADRDAVFGPIRRTWAAPFDVQGERVAVLVLEELPHFGESMAEARGARDCDTLPLDPAG